MPRLEDFVPYQAMVDDNFHFGREDERYEHGVFRALKKPLRLASAPWMRI
jgi:hypothetical protein